jgi:hypothetical protein
METASPPLNATSARPAVTAAVMAETGLHEAGPRQSMLRLHGKVRDATALFGGGPLP